MNHEIIGYAMFAHAMFVHAMFTYAMFAYAMFAHAMFRIKSSKSNIEKATFAIYLKSIHSKIEHNLLFFLKPIVHPAPAAPMAHDNILLETVHVHSL